MNEHNRVKVGCVTDRFFPLDKRSCHEGHACSAFHYDTALGDCKFTSGSRPDQSNPQQAGASGGSARWSLRRDHPLTFIHNDLIAPVGDRILVHLNAHTLGRHRFGENLGDAGIAFQTTKQPDAVLVWAENYVINLRATACSPSVTAQSALPVLTDRNAQDADNQRGKARTSRNRDDDPSGRRSRQGCVIARLL